MPPSKLDGYIKIGEAAKQYNVSKKTIDRRTQDAKEGKDGIQKYFRVRVESGKVYDNVTHKMMEELKSQQPKWWVAKSYLEKTYGSKKMTKPGKSDDGHEVSQPDKTTDNDQVTKLMSQLETLKNQYAELKGKYDETKNTKLETEKVISAIQSTNEKREKNIIREIQRGNERTMKGVLKEVESMTGNVIQKLGEVAASNKQLEKGSHRSANVIEVTQKAKPFKSPVRTSTAKTTKKPQAKRKTTTAQPGASKKQVNRGLMGWFKRKAKEFQDA